MRRVLGIDLAVTAQCRACLADARGEVVVERRFRIRRNELEALFEAATEGMSEDDELVVVMEPTSSMWIAPSAFFSVKGATVHLVPPEQAADLRRYYNKHVKNDRIDAKLLARLPLLHPGGLHNAHVPRGPQGVLKRIVRRRARLISELGQHRHRVRSTLHYAMPGLNEILGDQLGRAAMALLGRYGSPRAMLRVGKARIATLFIKNSNGQWRHDKAEQVLAAARAAIELWDGLDGCDFEEIAEDLACEARIIRTLEAEIADLDARAAGLLAEVDPDGLLLSLPGFGERTATTVAGRLGDVRRFPNAAALRSFIGIIPGTDQSGEAQARPRLTKSGDRMLRTALFLAAETARKEDPQLADVYLRHLEKGNHHTKALCAVATALANRLAAVLREGRPYEIRDVDGKVIDARTAKAAITERSRGAGELRAARRQLTPAKRQKERHLDGVRSKAKPSPPGEVTPANDARAVARSA
jgi:transposase